MQKIGLRLGCLALSSLVILSALAGCSREDIDYDAGSTPMASLSGNQDGQDVPPPPADDDNGIRTPGDLGYTGEDIQFDLGGPGDPSFDSINLGSNDTPEDVTPVDPDNTFQLGDPGLTPDPTSAPEDTTPPVETNAPEEDNKDEDLPDLNDLVTPPAIEPVKPDPTKQEEPAEVEPSKVPVTDTNKLPNTGIFLEDD